jgi:hypothetical protein
MNSKKALWICLFVIAIAIVTGIVWLIQPQKIQIEGGIPQKEIVFRKWPFSPSPVSFINADGSGYEEREINHIADPVTWSEGGKYLNLRLQSQNIPGSGYAFMVSMDGQVHHCSQVERDQSSLHFRSRDDLQVLLVKYSEDPERVVWFDMAACREGATVYIASPENLLREVVLSSQKYLAVETLTKFPGVFPDASGVLILGPIGEEISMIPHATLPAWSKDGEWLAYNLMEGSSVPLPLYVSKKDGSGQKSLGVKNNDTPAWSPDGEWLVYERDKNIYKFNLQTGQEIKIFEGGLSPDWRKIP